MSENQITQLPSWQFFIRYVLEALADGQVQHRRDLKHRATSIAPISDEQREIVFDDGESKAEHRCGWAMSALTRVQAVEKPSRGYYQITKVGRDLLKEFPDLILERDLMSLPAWAEYQPTKREHPASNSLSDSNSFEGDPIERIGSAVNDLEQSVASELLVKLRTGSPAFFERAVLDLLAAMGYGGIEKNKTHN